MKKVHVSVVPNKQTNKRTNKRTNERTNEQNKQTNKKQTDKQTNKQTNISFPISEVCKEGDNTAVDIHSVSQHYRHGNRATDSLTV